MDRNARHMAVLGVTPDASAEELKAAWRKLLLRWHPDRHFGEPEVHRAALERTKEINEAYGALSSRAAARGEGEPPEGRGRYRRPAFPSEFAPERPLSSRTIVSAGYDDRYRLLYLKFRKGVVYVYYDVPRSVYEGLLSARSHERYADGNLFGLYPCTRV